MPNKAVLITIGVPLLMYLAQSAQYLIQQHRYGMALTMVMYAGANVGLILDSMGY